jgi:hypothetical protein
MLVFFAICVVYYKELSLEEVFQASSIRIWNFYSPLKVFFKKITLKDIDTQAIQGIAILKDLIDSLKD